MYQHTHQWVTGLAQLSILTIIMYTESFHQQLYLKYLNNKDNRCVDRLISFFFALLANLSLPFISNKFSIAVAS
jgi:hypothetical protein